jgi:hypothetical protein
VDTKLIPLYLIEGLEKAKNLREEADYYDRWSETGCEKIVKLTREFYNQAKKLID